MTTYIGQGAPRFFFSYNPELPDPAFAKLVVLTARCASARSTQVAAARADRPGTGAGGPRACLATHLRPLTRRYLVNFRVMGPTRTSCVALPTRSRPSCAPIPILAQVNQDWGERTPTVHFVLDQDRLQLMGLSSSEAAQQLQFLLTGVPVTQVREDIRTVEVVARSAGPERLDPARLGELTLTSRTGRVVPLSQIGHVEIRPRIRSSGAATVRRPSPSNPTSMKPCSRLKSPWRSRKRSRRSSRVCRTVIGSRPAGNIEDSAKANSALLPVFPVMVLLTLLVLVLQTRSLSAMTMVFLTAPLGLVGAVPILLILHQPFGFNAILGLIGLSGILMRNTLILIGQIHTNEAQGLDPYHAVIEATVQRARPVLLTALAAVLAFIPLTTSVFWGSMACTLIGGTAAGTVLTLALSAGALCHVVPGGQAGGGRSRGASLARHTDARLNCCSGVPEVRLISPKIANRASIGYQSATAGFLPGSGECLKILGKSSSQRALAPWLGGQ